MSEIETKTEAELAIGDVLAGAESELRAQGCLLFKEVEEDDEEDEEGGPAQDFDEEEYEDAFLAHWEKWELVGPGRYDYWVEVHHDSGEISLYEPLPSVGLANQIDPIDPTDLIGLQEDQSVTLTGSMGGRRAVVTERRLGCIKEVMGQTTYPTSPGEVVIDITIKTEGRDGASITFENRSGHPLRAYRKQVLSNRQQKRRFGRIIYPSSGVFDSLPGSILQAVLYIVGVGVIFKIILYLLYLM